MQPGSQETQALEGPGASLSAEPQFTPEAVVELFRQGWPRLAARLARGIPISPEVMQSLGLTLGDGTLFWAARPGSNPPEPYWASAVPVGTPPEIQVRLMQSWPRSEVSALPLASSLFLQMRNPGSEGREALRRLLSAPFPRFLQPLSEAWGAIRVPEAAWENLVGVVVLPNPTLPDRQKLARLATFLGVGLAWSVGKRLSGLDPRRFPQEWAGFAWQAHDPKSALEAIDDPASSPWAEAFEDYLGALEETEFAGLAARRPRLLGIRKAGLDKARRILAGRDPLDEGTQVTRAVSLAQTVYMPFPNGPLPCFVGLEETGGGPIFPSPMFSCQVASLAWELRVRSPSLPFDGGKIDPAASAAMAEVR